MRRLLKNSAVQFLVAICFVVSASAQSISLTSPLTNIETNEGDDYASVVLGNAWDFAERRDFGWEEKFIGTQITVENGIWRGVSEATPAYVFPLFNGFVGSILAEGLPGDRSLPRFGKNHPINSNKYSLLSFRSRNSVHDALVVDWNTSAATWPNNRAAKYDGYAHRSNPYLRSGWNGYVFDMKNLAAGFDAGQITGSWTGNVTALSIHPATFAAAGTVTEFDWVRLTDPTSAPNVTISWSTSSLDQIPHPGGVIGVYFDNDNSGFDGSALEHYSSLSDPGSYTFSLAALPPGDYYFYVAVHQPGNDANVYARSGYSARIRILPAPQGYFSSPSKISGADYATTELGNPWDMDSETDIDNLANPWPEEWRQFINHNFTNGIFSAIADIPWAGRTTTDVQVHMNIPRVQPVDTRKYRYLNVRIFVDPTLYPTLHDKVHWGWVFRPIFWWARLLDGVGGFADGGMGAHFTMYEGWHTYTLDLWDPASWEGGMKWLDLPWIAHLRLDPLETNAYTWFSIDFVQLNAEPRTDANGIFPIVFSFEDADSATVNVSLYRDVDKTGADGTRIANLGALAPGSYTHNWNTAGIPAGNRYYVYAVLNDGTNTRVVYSDTQMVVGTYYNPVPAPVAPDALGRSDMIWGGSSLSPKNFVYRGGNMRLIANVRDSMMGIRRVWAVVTCGPKRFKKTISMRHLGNNQWGAGFRVPVNKDKKRRYRYDFTFWAQSTGGVVQSRRGSAISIAAMKPVKKVVKKK